VLFAWVDHTDLKPHNTFVAYDPQRRYLRHYFLDFGEALGVAARIDRRVYVGYRTAWGVPDGLRSLLSLGLWVPPWERKPLVPTLRGVGFFDARTFSPAHWSPNHRWEPMVTADRFDDYWAGVILMKITPAHVRAAVEAGRYSDPRAIDYVTRTLLERREKLGRWTLSRVAPLENFDARAGAGGRFALCFDDLWVRYRFGPEGETRYRAQTYDFDGRHLPGRVDVAPARGSRACLEGLVPGRIRDDYTMVRIAAVRGSSRVPEIYVHLARDPAGALRVIGLDRR
jgi:hypothetical protein